ncbi:MAG: segregation/condensation protein A [Pyrinomonadaceae bacterium]|nr:segregation/condensation protein A [Pyrinomonadaceae bacterium]
MESQPEQLVFDFFKEQPQIIAERNDEELKLKIGEFAGPLDLLLYLIRQEQANIFEIPIAKITDEYLRVIRLMEKLDISVAGDFLVMAATLIEIKSKMLLPREIVEENDEDADDPLKELVNRLVEYEKFKNAAQMLWEKSTVEQSIFPRGKIETDENNSEINVGVFDLLNVFQKILSRRKEEIQMEIEREEMSLSEMLSNIKLRLKQSKTFNVTEFFNHTRSKKELVLAFMAILEIVRTEAVKLLQENIFGEIILTKG